MDNHRELLLEQASQGKLIVRDMVSDDLSQVLLIEKNAQASPWGRSSFEESLIQDHRCRLIEGIIKEQPHLLGYHIVCPVLNELHILNVVVAPRYQGLGLGHSLVDDIISIAKDEQLAKVFLEVRAGNTAAQHLYLKWQFVQIALRKNYYRPNDAGQREDALIYVREIS